MNYDKDNDFYICHNNKKSIHVSNKTRRSKSRYKANVKVYKYESCEDCEYKNKCTRAKKNRRLYVSKIFIKKRENSRKNITSKRGTILRMNCSIQVENAFDILKENYGFRWFLMRRKKTAKIEFILWIQCEQAT